MAFSSFCEEKQIAATFGGPRSTHPHPICQLLIFLPCAPRQPVVNMLFCCSHGEDWQPLVLYRNSLVHGEGELPTVTSKRPYGRKRRGAAAAGDDDADDDDDADMQE